MVTLKAGQVAPEGGEEGKGALQAQQAAENSLVVRHLPPIHHSRQGPPDGRVQSHRIQRSHIGCISCKAPEPSTAHSMGEGTIASCN